MREATPDSDRYAHVVQAQFGHSNLAVTSRYVSHLQPQAVVDAMQARRWE
jgi:hypothetical protein